LNIGAVDAKERLTGVNVLAGLAHEQLLDVALGPHGNDGYSAFVVHHGADGADQDIDHALLHHFGAYTAALNFFETYLNGLAARPHRHLF
jgi:hypothetical protein